MSQTLDTKTTNTRWQPYPEYKDAGVEWLGEIPSHWEVKRLKVFASVNMGQSPSSEEYNQSGIGLPFLQGNADFGSLHPSPKTYCETAKKTAFQNDILLSVRAPVGQMNVADQPYGIGRGLCAITPHSDIDRNYLWFLLYLIREELSSVSTGSTYDAVSIDEVKRLTGCLPPLPEQRAIAVFLDRETAHINALIAKKQHLIDLLREKRTALISHGVTKGLDSTALMKDSGVTWLGAIPQGWEVKRLKFVGYLFGGGTPFKGNPEYWTGNIPWVSPKDMKSEIITDAEDHITEIALQDSSTRLVPLGTVLIVVRSGILRHTIPVAINDKSVALNQDMKAVVPKSFLKAEYLASLIRGHQVALLSEWRKEGATVESIEHELLVNTVCPIPPFDEQIAIIDYIKKETTKIDALISTIEGGIKKLQEYSTALVSAAVTGKIDVRKGRGR